MRTDIQITVPSTELTRRGHRGGRRRDIESPDTQGTDLARRSGARGGRRDIEAPETEGTDLARRGGRSGRRHESEEIGRYRKVAQEFEGLLVESMVKEMRKGDAKSTLFGKDSGMETYRDMLDGEYVRLMTQKGGIGLADFMVDNTPPELMGVSKASAQALKAAKAAGSELDRVSSFAGTSRQSLQTGLPASGTWGANRRPGD